PPTPLSPLSLHDALPISRLLRIAGHVTEDRLGAHLGHELVAELLQLPRLHALQRVLVAALALTPAETQVLHRREVDRQPGHPGKDRKSTRLNSSHVEISY